MLLLINSILLLWFGFNEIKRFNTLRLAFVILLLQRFRFLVDNYIHQELKGNTV